MVAGRDVTSLTICSLKDVSLILSYAAFL
jgi:hypothetical protein